MGDAWADLSGGTGRHRPDDDGDGAARPNADLDGEARTIRELVAHCDNWNLTMTISRKAAISPSQDMLADETRWRIELHSEGTDPGKTGSGRIGASGPTVVLAAERLI